MQILSKLCLWQVYFLDYGNTEILAKNEIRPMEKEKFLKIPPQAIRCALQAVPPTTDSKKLIDLILSRDVTIKMCKGTTRDIFVWSLSNK